MSKKNLTVLFLLLSGVIAVLAYAGGKQSNWLSDDQINFAKGNLSTDRGNKLEAQLRDAVVNGLTTRAQNHEKRLQAFAQSTGYPNLTPEQTSFSDLLSTTPKNNNQLTAAMRNGLLTRLTYAVTNHEMRLRELERPTALPTKVDGKCGTAAATCLAGTVKWDNGKMACGTTRTWHCEGSNGWKTVYNCSFQNPACESYSCKGTYIESWNQWVWVKKDYDIFCFKEDGNYNQNNSSLECKTVSDDQAQAESPTTPNWPKKEGNGQWGIHDPTAPKTWLYPWISRLCSTEFKNGKPKYCSYTCLNTNISNIGEYCKKEIKYETKSCSSLSESACKAQVGCRWAKN